MKKIVLFIFYVCSLFVLVACDTGINNNNSQGNPLDVTKYKEELVNVFSDNIPNEVNENIELLDYYEYDDGSLAIINWDSSNGRTISKRGTYNQNLFDEKITLTANVELGLFDGNEVTFTYSKVVNTKGYNDVEEYKKIILSQVEDYIYKDITLIDRDQTFKDQNMFATIEWVSSRPDVLTHDGKYVNQEKDDQEIELTFNLEINGINITASKIVTVEGRKDAYYIDKANEFLDEHFKNVVFVYDDLDLPESDNLDRVKFTWKSSDLLVLSHKGELLTYEPNKFAKMVVEIKSNDVVQTREIDFRTYNDSEILDFIVLRMHRETIQQFNMRVYAYTAKNLGYLPFYTQDTALEDLVVSTTKNNEKINYLTGSQNKNVNKVNIETGLIPWDGTGRTKINKTSTDFITVHDTGDANHDAAWWNELESSGADDRQTSWHFTVGEDTVYQHVPLDEVAWHAGDGSNRFSLLDTGVKYDGPNPSITINEKEHMLYINNQKSKIWVPIINGSKRAEYNGRFATEISPAGLYTCRGENGNYYMADVYASNYWEGSAKYQVCTKGGNRNSVGFETCINQGVDYNKVIRNLSNIVANLLIYYDLDPSRVLYHQHFSGKLCPQVMIQNDMLSNMHNIIENEYIIKKYLDGVSFKYESKSLDVMDNNGTIIKKVTMPTVVDYTVTVSYKGQTKTFDLSTQILPIK